MINKLRQSGYQLEFNDRETQTIESINQFYNLRYPRRVEGPIEIGTDMLENIESVLDSLWKQFPGALVELYNEIDPFKKGGRVLMEKRINYSQNV